MCTEAGMFAIRARRKAITEKDLIEAIDKVIKGYKKFSATGKYMVYNWFRGLLFYQALFDLFLWSIIYEWNTQWIVLYDFINGRNFFQ